jgi:predicted XRE-type DNA-binding protein
VVAGSRRPLVWLGGELKTPPLSREARIEAGFLLRLIQDGDHLGMPHSRVMPSVGSRCHELRINDRDQTWRLIYRVDPEDVPSTAGVVRPSSERGQIMKAGKQRRLERAGWRVGTADEFLGLSKQESALVEVKLRLARRLRALRAQRGLSQAAVAKLVRSSQSRVAKMETGDATVSIDLLVRSLLAIGASPKDIARAIGREAA